jgi:hypothetical protein
MVESEVENEEKEALQQSSPLGIACIHVTGENPQYDCGILTSTEVH